MKVQIQVNSLGILSTYDNLMEISFHESHSLTSASLGILRYDVRSGLTCNAGVRRTERTAWNL